MEANGIKNGSGKGGGRITKDKAGGEMIGEGGADGPEQVDMKWGKPGGAASKDHLHTTPTT